MSAGRVVFVSDVHLHYGGDASLRTFLDFLDEVAGGCERLYVHGDLFDFYVGPRQGRLAFYAPLFEALARLVARGVRVTVLHGNRDFLIGRRFGEAGVAVVADEVVLELGGRRVHLSHGDQFCIHDRSYIFWARTVLRAPPVRLLVRSLPAAAALWLARRYRAVSARKMARAARRTQGRLPSILDGVERMLAARPFDVVICGHIHWLAETPLAVLGRHTTLLTTGAWEEGPNYVEWDGESFALRRFVPARAAAGSGSGAAAWAG